jgi:hypothetical protein
MMRLWLSFIGAAILISLIAACSSSPASKGIAMTGPSVAGAQISASTITVSPSGQREVSGTLTFSDKPSSTVISIHLGTFDGKGAELGTIVARSEVSDGQQSVLFTVPVDSNTQGIRFLGAQFEKESTSP